MRCRGQRRPFGTSRYPPGFGQPRWAWITPSSRVFISTTWTWLEDQRLIRSERDSNLRRIFLLDDGGTGQALRARAGNGLGLLQAHAPLLARWWSERLSLPGKATLLIALSLPKSFRLPQEHEGTWYGVSRDTIRHGIGELIEHDLLDMQSTFKKALRSPTGTTEERRYAPKEPFTRLPRRSRATPG